jgi:anaerobic dimethyl sulfoxide reductase subunit B (iron-sulfur subunit)
MTTTTSSSAPIPQGMQYGFFYDQSRCIGCANCVLACIGTKRPPQGQAKLLGLYQWETGTFPNVTLNIVWAPCYHCTNPVCVSVANGALIKEPSYGAVLIDPNLATSAALKAAWEACPYGAISFDSGAPDSTAYKCDMCIDRLMVGKFPSCVLACPTRALDFGPITTLEKMYGSQTVPQLDGMPSSTTTSPAIIFKPHAAKTSLVPYDANAAITLLATAPYATFYTSSSAVTSIPAGTVARTSLNMKASGQQKQLLTMDDSM